MYHYIDTAFDTDLAPGYNRQKPSGARASSRGHRDFHSDGGSHPGTGTGALAPATQRAIEAARERLADGEWVATAEIRALLEPQTRTDGGIRTVLDALGAAVSDSGYYCCLPTDSTPDEAPDEASGWRRSRAPRRIRREPEAKRCPVCGATFNTKNRRRVYCSKICAGRARDQRKRAG